MKGFVYVQSLKLVGLVLVGSLGLTSATGTPAADKVWFDDKAFKSELKDKFGSIVKMVIRDDPYSLGYFKTAVTETDGFQIRFRAKHNGGIGGFADMFLEFDKKGQLQIAKASILYGKKSYTPKAVDVSSLKLARNEPRMSLIEKVADALMANVKSTPIKQVGNVRTPNFGAAIRYATVMVAKHTWYGPKVTDHRTGSTGRDDRRGDGGR